MNIGSTSRATAFMALLFTAVGLCAQPYRAFVDTTAFWQDRHWAIEQGENTQDYQCFKYFFSGDSVVNDTAYKILVKTGRHSRSSWGPPNISWTHLYYGALVGLLREDTVSRQVFIRPLGWPYHEVLMYDFSGVLGPYPSTYRYPGLGWEVTAVDLVELADGPHRRIMLDGWLEIIEGIGSTRCFLEPENLWGSGPSDLMCHVAAGIENDFETSGLGAGCLCGTISGIASPAVERLVIGPSPTTDLCHLEGAQPNAGYIVRTMDGRTLLTGRCSGNGTADIDVRDLPAAVYLLSIMGEEAPLSTKIVKE